MIIKSKHLADSAWKDLASKHKLKDNGLTKALERLKRLPDDDHDAALEALDAVSRLAGGLKKDKAVAAAPAASRHVADLLAAADEAARAIAKAKADEHKARQARAADDDDETESPQLLTTQLKAQLKLVAKGQTMYALVARSGKQAVVMLSKKPIPPARRKLLAEQLGGGAVKYFAGQCGVEGGAVTFALQSEVAGMSRLVKQALLEQTGVRLNKLRCRGNDGDDVDDDADGAGEERRDAAPAADPIGAGSAAAAGAAVPLMPVSGMKDEEIAAAIMDKQVAILEGWEAALDIFDKTMTSAADAEAAPDYQQAVLDHFKDKLMGALIERAPGMSELSALMQSVQGEYQRASQASASATLRDFVNRHAKAVSKLVQATLAQRQGFISAVRARREAAGVDVAPRAAQGGRGPGGVEVNPAELEAWSAMRLALVETEEAVQRVLGRSTPEALLRVLTEAWVRQGTVRAGMGHRVQAMVVIKLNPDHSIRGAHIQGAGGQKLAEQLLDDAPGGVDVIGLRAPRRIVHYAENGWPQAVLSLDANGRDVSTGSRAEGDSGALYRYLKSRGLPPTTKLTGD